MEKVESPDSVNVSSPTEPSLLTETRPDALDSLELGEEPSTEPETRKEQSVGSGGGDADGSQRDFQSKVSTVHVQLGNITQGKSGRTRTGNSNSPKNKNANKPANSNS